jgi:hypothetical protein
MRVRHYSIVHQQTGLRQGLMGSAKGIASTYKRAIWPQITHIKTWKANACVLFLFFMLIGQQLWGQNPYPTLPDSLRGDTIRPSSNVGILQPGPKTIRFSPDSLDAPVEYDAKDSMVLDNINKKIYLYGQAVIKYQDLQIDAAFVELDWGNNLVTAEVRIDSTTGKMIGQPHFKQGEQVFDAKRMRYNFKTQKGMVYDVRTTQKDIIAHGAKMKFIAAPKRDSTSQDTAKANNIIFGSRMLFTTCQDPEHPHFGIRSRKQKIIQDKIIVVGPSQLEIMGVPTPLVLPFGFFPLKKQRSTGLLFPRDYEYSENWGFGLRDIGWYFPVGDNLNLALRGDIYFRGTYGIGVEANYIKRYKYRIGSNVRFQSQISENTATGKFQRTNSYSIQGNISQETGAHPNARINGSINLQGNGFQNRVFNDAQSVLTSQINSNLNFTKNWPGKPYSLTSSINLSQNIRTKVVTASLPNLNFSTETLYPFKKKVSSGKEAWYETIALRYAGEARNSFVTADTAIFSRKTWENALIGARHNAQMNTSFKLFRHFNINPNISYDETWQMKSLDREFLEAPVTKARRVFNLATQDSITVVDTLSYGRVKSNVVNGFSRFNQFQAGVSMNTRLFFGLKTGKFTPLRELRWEMRPSFSFNYSPNYLNPRLGYFDSVQVDSRFPNRKIQYSRFDSIAVYGTPSASGKQMAIGYSFNNIFQAKAWNKKDSTFKKLKLIDNFIFGGNYNFAADSLKFSPVSFSTTARFFKGTTTVGFNMSMDPYIRNAQGIRINKFAWTENRQLLRFENARLSVTTDLTVGKIRAIFRGEEEEVVTDLRSQPARKKKEESGDFLSLFENFGISHNLDFTWQSTGQGTEFRIGSNSINAQGNIALTKNWAINVGNIGYDFVNKGLSYPAVGFSRDLHCWNLAFNWQPQRGTYVLNLAVKPGSLDFLKIPYSRNNFDGRRGF